MGRNNAVTKRFCSDRVRFADLVNGVYFNGRCVIHSEDLAESSEGYAQPVEQTEAEEEREYLERERDIKMLHRSGSTIRILAVENQSYIDYGMPIRCMEYDALEYRKQMEMVKKQNQQEQDFFVFHTQLRSVFELLPLRKDKKRLLEKLTEDEAYSHMDEDSLEFLSVVMDNPTIWKNRSKYRKRLEDAEEANKNEQEEYDMCQAIRELIEDGKQEGRLQILVDMVKEGILKIEDAASRCDLTVEEFCKQMAVAAN